MNSAAEIMDTGMNCLLANLGAIDTEKFISTILRERGDYTKWRRKYFDHADLETFHRDAVEYGKKNPFYE